MKTEKFQELETGLNLGNTVNPKGDKRRKDKKRKKKFTPSYIVEKQQITKDKGKNPK